MDISGCNEEVSQTFNREANKYFRYLIHKGIPNYLMRDVVRNIVPYDEVVAMSTYRNFTEYTENIQGDRREYCFLT